MIKINTLTSCNIYLRSAIDRRVSLLVGGIPGVGWGGSYNNDGGFTALLYDNATLQQQDDVQAILDNLDVLDIAATKTTIIAEGVDSTIITCAALGATFDYVIYLNSVFEQSGSVTDGGIDFTAIEAGVYTIEIRNPANFETGFVEITGVESA